jgi:glucokinase
MTWPMRPGAPGADAARDGSYLGVDVGGTSIKWALLAGGATQRAGQVMTPRTGTAAVLEVIGQLHREHAPGTAGLGLAMPGVVDGARGETLFVPNVPGDWAGAPVSARLEAQCGIPVSLLNDARALAHAELHAGGARGESAALFVVLGTGVGGAVALDGRVVVGAVDAFGEIGHQVAEPRGDRCACGGTGCLETVASGPAIARRARAAVESGQSARLVELTGGRPELLTAELVARAADDGDPWATAALDRAGTAVGIAAVSACLLLQLKVVLIGGGVARAFRRIAPAARRVLAERPELTGAVALRPAELGTRAGALGAAMWAAARGAEGQDRLPTGAVAAGERTSRA